MGFEISQFSEPSLLGAFLGAIVTGLIAITVMIIQIIYDHKKSKKNQKSNYKRTFILFKQHYTIIQGNLKNMPFLIEKILNGIISPVDANPDEDKWIFDTLADSIYYNTMELEKLDFNNIPEDIFEDFIRLKNLCGEISSLLQRFKSRKDFDCTVPLEEFIRKSEKTYERLLKYYQDKWKII